MSRFIQFRLGELEYCPLCYDNMELLFQAAFSSIFEVFEIENKYKNYKPFAFSIMI